jgi:hypothetical protein
MIWKIKHVLYFRTFQLVLIADSIKLMLLIMTNSNNNNGNFWVHSLLCTLHSLSSMILQQSFQDVAIVAVL